MKKLLIILLVVLMAFSMSAYCFPVYIEIQPGWPVLPWDFTPEMTIQPQYIDATPFTIFLDA